MRQLENICHWLTVMAPAQVIEAEGPAARAAGAGARLADADAGSWLRRRRPPASRGRRPRRRRRRRCRPTAAPPAAGGAADAAGSAAWSSEARRLLEAGEPEVWDTLTRKFEAQLIHTALEITRGRRIEAAQKLGIGRNTITRKIQELGLDEK